MLTVSPLRKDSDGRPWERGKGMSHQGGICPLEDTVAKLGDRMFGSLAVGKELSYQLLPQNP